MSRETKKEVLTTKEAAKRLEAGESSIRLWCSQGRFEGAIRVGRDWIIPESSLEGFVKRERGRPTMNFDNSSKRTDKGRKKNIKIQDKGSG